MERVGPRSVRYTLATSFLVVGLIVVVVVSLCLGHFVYQYQQQAKKR